MLSSNNGTNHDFYKLVMFQGLCQKYNVLGRVVQDYTNVESIEDSSLEVKHKTKKIIILLHIFFYSSI